MTDISELLERDKKIEELSRLLGAEQGFAGMVGTSAVMQRVYRIIEKAAASDAPVIIYGESGTGKELAARAIHTLGLRSNGPFIQLNCAALNEALLESELFGHVRGAFTGAVKDREGRFEAAHGGDIFLDEIGDVPLPTQVKLLRVLETKRIERVGENHPMLVDVRVISATNKNIHQLVLEQHFREDLLFRINTLPIHLPPLRERTEDIPLLITHFIQGIRERTAKDIDGFTPAALRCCMEYRWPGNIRELRNAVEYAFVIAETGRIDVEHLPPVVAGGEVEAYEARQPVATGNMGHGNRTDHAGGAEVANEVPEEGRMPREKAELLAALREASGNLSQAARLLGVHRGTVRNRMLKWQVDVKKAVFNA